MVALVLPPSVPVEAMMKFIWVPTLADPNAPKLTEIGPGVATAIDVSCYFTKDGYVKATMDQSTFVDARACTSDEWELLGGTKRGLEDIQYIYDPQAAALAAMNAAYEKLTPGLKGYFVIRDAVAYEVALAVGQFVDVWGATLGSRVRVADVGAVFKQKQKLGAYFFSPKVALVA